MVMEFNGGMKIVVLICFKNCSFNLFQEYEIKTKSKINIHGPALHPTRSGLSEYKT